MRRPPFRSFRVYSISTRPGSLLDRSHCVITTSCACSRISSCIAFPLSPLLRQSALPGRPPTFIGAPPALYNRRYRRARKRTYQEHCSKTSAIWSAGGPSSYLYLLISPGSQRVDDLQWVPRPGARLFPLHLFLAYVHDFMRPSTPWRVAAQCINITLRIIANHPPVRIPFCALVSTARRLAGLSRPPTVVRRQRLTVSIIFASILSPFLCSVAPTLSSPLRCDSVSLFLSPTCLSGVADRWGGVRWLSRIVSLLATAYPIFTPLVSLASPCPSFSLLPIPPSCRVTVSLPHPEHLPSAQCFQAHTPRSLSSFRRSLPDLSLCLSHISTTSS
ncbi:hypothetical protein FKP32DRAFT_79090 [Trametes sanguinea]|nr:hypothetical protein FKP32DRAFT_79090 [Trametes sanguinea]